MDDIESCLWKKECGLRRRKQTGEKNLIHLKALHDLRFMISNEKEQKKLVPSGFFFCSALYFFVDREKIKIYCSKCAWFYFFQPSIVVYNCVNYCILVWRLMDFCGTKFCFWWCWQWVLNYGLQSWWEEISVECENDAKVNFQLILNYCHWQVY